MGIKTCTLLLFTRRGLVCVTRYLGAHLNITCFVETFTVTKWSATVVYNGILLRHILIVDITPQKYFLMACDLFKLLTF